MNKIINITLMCLSLLTFPIFASDFEDGMRLYSGKDYIGAVNLFKRSAEQGAAEAQYNLAIMYTNGQGVNQDYQQAANWY